jgi:hypothetical protein
MTVDAHGNIHGQGGKFAGHIRGDADGVELDNEDGEHSDHTYRRDQWAGVDVAEDDVYRMEAAGIDPDDFESDDRDRRLWACTMRGDLTFEGKLTENARKLRTHTPVAHNDDVIPVSGKVWVDTEKAAAYIDGFAAGVEACERAMLTHGDDWLRSGTLIDRGWEIELPDTRSENPEAARARVDGFSAAYAYRAFEFRAGRGDVPETVEVIEPLAADSTGRVRLTNIRPSAIPGHFEGKPTTVKQQLRYTNDGGVTTWSPSARVAFRPIQVAANF